MIAKIEPPGFNTSMQILRSRTADSQKKIPDNVLEFISEKFNDAQLAETHPALDVLCLGTLPKSVVAFL